MSIPHLKQRAEFYAMCLEHGEENVEWCLENQGAGRSPWLRYPPNFDLADQGRGFEFRLRPRTAVIPKAAVPEEDPEGKYCFGIITWHKTDDGLAVDNPDSRKSYVYRTAADRDAVVAAMLNREVK